MQVHSAPSVIKENAKEYLKNKWHLEHHKNERFLLRTFQLSSFLGQRLACMYSGHQCICFTLYCLLGNTTKRQRTRPRPRSRTEARRWFRINDSRGSGMWEPAVAIKKKGTAAERTRIFPPWWKFAEPTRWR